MIDYNCSYKCRVSSRTLYHNKSCHYTGRILYSGILIYPFEYCYLTNIGPPGPTGIPNKNQMMTNTVHTILSAIEYCYLTNIGPPGPTGIPNKNQMMTNTVHTILSAIEYGIKLESKAPNFMRLSYFCA